MKGTIIKCLGDMVTEKFGKEKWQEIVTEVPDLPKTVLPISDIKDEQVMALIQAGCQKLNITLQQAADAFGEYWVNVYAPKYYSSYFNKVKTAKEFIINMDRVHDAMTKNMKNAAPPRFEYKWLNDKELEFYYKSKRGLIDIAIGCIKGVGTYYKEKLTVQKLSDEKVKVVFSN